MIVKLYLFLYNAVQFLGWATVLYTLSQSLYPPTSEAVTLACSSTVQTVNLLQTLACLEVFNSAVGFVSGSPMSAFMQVFGRNVVQFGFIHPLSLSNVYVVSLYLAWATAECIRYPFYALNIVKSCPFQLTWLRYSAFIVLYPIGMLSEVAVLISSLPFANFGYYNIAGQGNLVYVMVPYILYAYLVAGPKLIKYMLKARKKVLKINLKSE